MSVIVVVLALLAGVDRSAADQLFEQGKWAEARAAYEEVLPQTEEPKEKAEVLVRIGRTFLGEGDYWEAERWFSRSLEVRETADALMHRGQAFLFAGMDVAAERGAGDPEVQALMNDARRSLTRSIELTPSSAAWVLLGRVESYRGKAEEQEKALRAALALSPKDPEASYYLAWLLEQTGRSEEARSVLEAVPPDRRALGHYLSLGRLYAAAGERKAAVRAYLDALHRDPEESSAYQGIWNLTGVERRFAEFEDAMDEVIRSAPEAWSPHYYLGFCQTYAKRHQEAIRSFEKALELKPGEVRALSMIARIKRLDLRDEEGAAEVYLKILELDPQNDQARLVLSDLAYRKAQAGEYDFAQRLLTALAKAEPQRWEHLSNLALLEKERGNIDRALEIYRDAEERFPFEPQLPNDRGLLLMGQGRTKEAFAAFEKALGRDPEFLDTLENMGAYTRLNGDPKAALGYFLTAYDRVRSEGGDASKFRRYLDQTAREIEEAR